MGYTTRHELKINTEVCNDTFEKIEKYINENNLNEWAINTLNGNDKLLFVKYEKDEDDIDEEDLNIYFGEEDSNWYEHKEDMIKMSKEFPAVEFSLHGEGEDRDDVWTEIYFNGEEKKKDNYDLLAFLLKKFSKDADNLGFDVLGGNEEDCIVLEIKVKK